MNADADATNEQVADQLSEPAEGLPATAESADESATGRGDGDRERLPAVARWMIWLLPSVMRPVRAIRATEDAGLWMSWASHLFGLVLGAVVFVLLAAWSDAARGRSPISLIVAVVEDVNRVVRELAMDGEALVFAIVTTAMGLVFIHAGTVVVAAALMAWSARGGEMVSASWARTMQRLWRLTPHAALMLAVLGGLGVGAERWWTEWWPGMNWWRVEAFVYSGLWLAGVVWGMVVVGWALHPGRERARCRWPAHCDACGYSLLGIDNQQTCPECGLAKRQSIDPAARPGTVWARSSMQPTRLATACWQCVTGAIAQPDRLGASLHLLAPGGRHRTFLVMNLLAVAFVTLLAALMTILMVYAVASPSYQTPWQRLREFSEMLVVMTAGGGAMAMALMAGTLMAGAGFVGMIASRVYGRNLLPAALQGACYLAGYAVAALVVLWLYIMTWIVLVGLLSIAPNTRLAGMRAEELSFTGGIILASLLVIVYLALLWRITRAARHANW